MRYFNTCLHGHGKGAYHGWALRRSYWGKGVRLSIGGYGWDREWWRPHYQRYRRNATHVGIGPVCVSFLAGRLA